MKTITIKHIGKQVFHGEYFIFIQADELNPVKIRIKESDRDTSEKIFLSPGIFFLDEIDIDGEDFYCSGKKPVYIPTFLCTPAKNKIKISDQERFYKKAEVFIVPEHETESPIPDKRPDSHYKHTVSFGQDHSGEIRMDKPVFRFRLYLENRNEFLYLGKKILIDKNNIKKLSPVSVCAACGSLFRPSVRIKIPEISRKNYVPFFDMVDKDNFSDQQIMDYLKKTRFPKDYTWGLKRLLTLLRSAVPADEISVIENLYCNDEDFADFIVSKIFSLELFPLMYRKDIQYVLNSFDTEILAAAFKRTSVYIKETLFRNVSKNRKRMIKDEWTTLRINELNETDNNKASADIGNFYRNFLEVRQGRSLRIKTGEIHGLKAIKESPANKKGEFDFRHKGPVIGIDGENVYKLFTGKGTDSGCMNFDQAIHYSDKPFIEIISADGSGFYLYVHVSLLLLHIYEQSLFSREIISNVHEYIEKGSILYLKSIRDSVNYYIAGFDMGRQPFEQVIRAGKNDNVPKTML